MVTDNINICPECRGRHLVRDYERAEIVCQDCGLVIDHDIIDQGQDWRNFADGSDRSHAGAPKSYLTAGNGLSTEISPVNKDSYGRRLPARSISQFRRMRQWQKRTRIANGAERSLGQAIGEIRRTGQGLGLAEGILECIAKDYKSVSAKGLIKGRSVRIITAAVTYAVCRKYSIPRTLDEVAQAAGCGKKEIGRAYRTITRHMHWALTLTRPEDYVMRFCSQLDLRGEIPRETMQLIETAARNEIDCGRNPVSVAAACIYLASGKKHHVTQTQISRVTGISEVTIRVISRNIAAAV